MEVPALAFLTADSTSRRVNKSGSYIDKHCSSYYDDKRHQLIQFCLNEITEHGLKPLKQPRQQLPPYIFSNGILTWGPTFLRVLLAKHLKDLTFLAQEVNIQETTYYLPHISLSPPLTSDGAP